jgi:5-methylthioadenosine/S-adenosylhomocysteine deaminase
MIGLLLKNCEWIATQDPQRRVLRNTSVRIVDGKIEEIGKIRANPKDKVIDCKLKLLIPGLINTHTHLSMTLFRGYADDLELREWLEKKIWPLEARLTGKMCYNGAMLGALEMIRTGTTSFVDMYFHMEDVATAVSKAGLRAVLSNGIIDKPDAEGTMRERKTTLKFLQHVRKLHNPLIEFAVGPHAPYTCGKETLLWSKDIAEKENVLINIHIAETRGEQAQFEKDGKGRVVEYLDKIGFLTDRVLAAHSVWLTKSEVKILGSKGVRVAHCPVSNMKLASGGTAPIPEMWESGVPVGLGTDGPASNNGLDMFDTMKMAALSQKNARWDPTIMNAQRVLDMATIDGARCIGHRFDLGSVEVGKRADLVLLDLQDPNLVPIHGKETVVSNLVYSANGHNVDTTIVNGKPLMVNREFVGLDPKKINEDVRSSVAELISQ